MAENQPIQHRSTQGDAEQMSERQQELSSRKNINVSSVAIAAKTIIDQGAQQSFSAGRSSIDICRELTSHYCGMMKDILDATGLGDIFSHYGLKSLRAGGFARDNSAVRSDFDLVFWGPEPDIKRAFSGEHDLILRSGMRALSDLTHGGIKVSSPFRSEQELEQLVLRNDLDSITALLSARPLAVTADVPADLSQALSSLIDKNYNWIIASICTSVQERERQYGSILNCAQYNLKESRGGLRDIDVLDWISQVSRMRGAADPVLELISLDDLRNAREIMLRAKLALHFAEGDVMPPEMRQTGFKKPFDKTNYLPFGERRESFLKLFSGSSCGLITEQDVDDLIYRAARLSALAVDRLLKQVAWGKSGVSLSVLEPSEKDLRYVLSESVGVAKSIGDWYVSGALSKLIPEFRRAESFVDRAGFHAFTLGKHLVETVARIEHLIIDGKRIYPEFEDIIVSDPTPLYLAGLLHDIAKADETPSSPHDQEGALIAERIARRIGLNTSQIERTRDLVADHMVLANLSGLFIRKQDVESLPERFSNPSYLRELLLLTLADRYASNPDTWNPTKELWIFATYHDVMRLRCSHQSQSEEILNDLMPMLMDTRSLSLREQCQEFVARTDKRILSHYSPSVLYHHAVTLDRVRRSSSETPFELALINEKGSQPLYHFVLSCKDSPGLFGRFYEVFRQRQMRLTSAYLHTIDGMVSDYLTVEPRYPDHQFVGDDLERLTATLTKAAYDVRHGPMTESKRSFGSGYQRAPRFELVADETHERLILSISDCIEPEFMGRLLKLLEVKKVEIKGAKLRAGNRQQRYVFFLDCNDAQSCSLELLSRELGHVLSPDSR